MFTLTTDNTVMNEMIPDKRAYQLNKRIMTYMCIGLMAVSTLAVIYDPIRMNEASAVLMMMYGSLSAVVGSYFGFSSSKK